MWLQDAEIGDLPETWNVLIGEKRPFLTDVRLAHYTLGVPGFPQYRECEYSAEWCGTYLRAINLIGENPLALTRRAMENACG
jgi:hypothetical protein